MTINRAQSQTLKAVGLYLPQPVFSHGHLYVATSRIGCRQQLKVFIEHDKPMFNNKEIDDNDETYTENVVYESVIQKLAE